MVGKRIKFYLLLSCLLHLSSCSEKEYETQLIRVNNGFGFEIKEDANVLIRQPFIPAAANKQAFKSKQEAQQVARLMIEKLTNNVFPPAISKHELDSLGITYTP